MNLVIVRYVGRKGTLSNVYAVLVPDGASAPNGSYVPVTSHSTAVALAKVLSDPFDEECVSLAGSIEKAGLVSLELIIPKEVSDRLKNGTRVRFCGEAVCTPRMVVLSDAAFVAEAEDNVSVQNEAGKELSAFVRDSGLFQRWSTEKP